MSLQDQAAASDPAEPQDRPAAISVYGGPLDESARRRPDFEEGHPVVLADGQAWHFRRPRVYFEPDDTPVGFRVGFTNGADDESRALRKALDDLGPYPMVRDLVVAELRLARYALLTNYDLDPDEVRRVLRFGYESVEDSDPDAIRIRTEVMAVLNGENGPKVEDGGEDS